MPYYIMKYRIVIRSYYNALLNALFYAQLDLSEWKKDILDRLKVFQDIV